MLDKNNINQKGEIKMTLLIEDNSVAKAVAEKAPKAEAPVFLIVKDKKRMVKTKGTGLVIEVLKRAKAPISGKTIVSRAKATKDGKALTNKDVAARLIFCANWWVKNTNYVKKNDKGEFYLTLA